MIVRRPMLFAIALVGCILAAKTEAQEWDPGGMLGMYAGTVAIEYEAKHLARLSQSRAFKVRSAIQAADTVVPLRTLTSFSANTAARQRNFARFVEKARAVDPAGVPALQEIIAMPGLMDQVAGKIAPYGLRLDDVADVVTVYLVSAYDAVHDRDGEPSRATAMALREQVARAIATTAQLETASAATKQELADATILHMLLLEAAREQAKRAGAAQQRAVADAARRGAKASFGLDLASMTLTEQGLVPAMEIGSVDSTSGEPKGRAAMSEADAGPSQGVIAQAGNKRLGAALLLSKVTGRRD